MLKLETDLAKARSWFTATLLQAISRRICKMTEKRKRILTDQKRHRWRRVPLNCFKLSPWKTSKNRWTHHHNQNGMDKIASWRSNQFYEWNIMNLLFTESIVTIPGTRDLSHHIQPSPWDSIRNVRNRLLQSLLTRKSIINWYDTFARRRRAELKIIQSFDM